MSGFGEREAKLVVLRYLLSRGCTDELERFLADLGSEELGALVGVDPVFKVLVERAESRRARAAYLNFVKFVAVFSLLLGGVVSALLASLTLFAWYLIDAAAGRVVVFLRKRYGDKAGLIAAKVISLVELAYLALSSPFVVVRSYLRGRLLKPFTSAVQRAWRYGRVRPLIWHSLMLLGGPAILRVGGYAVVIDPVKQLYGRRVVVVRGRWRYEEAWRDLLEYMRTGGYISELTYEVLVDRPPTVLPYDKTLSHPSFTAIACAKSVPVGEVRSNELVIYEEYLRELKGLLAFSLGERPERLAEVFRRAGERVGVGGAAVRVALEDVLGRRYRALLPEYTSLEVRVACRGQDVEAVKREALKTLVVESLPKGPYVELGGKIYHLVVEVVPVPGDGRLFSPLLEEYAHIALWVESRIGEFARKRLREVERELAEIYRGIGVLYYPAPDKQVN